MIGKVIDRVHDVVSTNFNTDFNALRGTVPALNFDTGNFFKWLAYEIFSQRVPAGIGIYDDAGASMAKLQTVRDSRVDVVVDVWISGSNPDDVAGQRRIAIQAVLRSIDQLRDGTNIVAAAEGELGKGEKPVTWEITRTTLSDESRIPGERALIRFPAWHRETGL